MYFYNEDTDSLINADLWYEDWLSVLVL
jgi:hypothetical protein